MSSLPSGEHHNLVESDRFWMLEPQNTDLVGADKAPDGAGEMREPLLYQRIRQKGPIVDRTFEIEFLDLGVHALDFTFG